MDWKTELAEFLPTRLNKNFKWGKYDCTTFAADCIVIISGYDFAEWWRGHYKTQKEAEALIQEFAGSLSKVMTKVAKQYNMEKVEKKFLQNGDLCLIDTDNGDALAIVWNGKIWAQAPTGLVILPKFVVKRAWRTKKKEDA